MRWMTQMQTVGKFSLLIWGCSLAVAQDGLPQDLAPNAWHKIELIDQVNPVHESKHTRVFYRDADQCMYLFGGDYAVHGSSYQQSGRQEFWKYCPSTNHWSLAHDYCRPAGSIQPERPDEMPIAYDSKRDRLYVTAGSWTKNPCGTQALKDTWAYWDFKTGNWIDTGVAHNRGGTKRAFYDPKTDSVYMFLWGGFGVGVQKFSVADQKQEQWPVAYDDRGKYMNNERLNVAQVAMVPELRSAFIVSPNSGILWRYNIDKDNRKNGDHGSINPAFTKVLQDPRLKSNPNASMLLWNSRDKLLVILINSDVKGKFTPYLLDPVHGQELRPLPTETVPQGQFPQGNTAVYLKDRNAILTFGAAFTDEQVPNERAMWLMPLDKSQIQASNPHANLFGPLRVQGRLMPVSYTAAASRHYEFVLEHPEVSDRLLPFFRDPAATNALTSSNRKASADPKPRYWSAPVFAARGNRAQILYFGGGHSDYPGNDVEVYDRSTRAWTQLGHPRVPAANDPMYGSGGSNNVFVCQKDQKDCKAGEWQPYTIHGYGRQSYDPGLDRYVVTATGCRRVGLLQGTYQCVEHEFGILGFDLNAKRWEFLSPPGSFKLSERADLTAYDSKLGGIVAYFGSSNESSTHTDALLFSDRAVRKLPSLNVNISLGGAGHGGNASVYVASLQKHLIATLPQGGSPQFALWLVDFARGSAVEVRVPAQMRALIGDGGNWQMAYDSVQDQILVVQADAQRIPLLTWWDPRTQQWTHTQSARGALRIEPQTASNGRDSLIFDSVNQQFLFIRPTGNWQTGKAELWALNASN